jgi:hypothetical protein
MKSRSVLRHPNTFNRTSRLLLLLGFVLLLSLLSSCGAVAPNVDKCKGTSFTALCESCHGWVCYSWHGERDHCGSPDPAVNKAEAQKDADAHNADNPGHKARAELTPNSN